MLTTNQDELRAKWRKEVEEERRHKYHNHTIRDWFRWNKWNRSLGIGFSGLWLPILLLVGIPLGAWEIIKNILGFGYKAQKHMML